MNNDNNVSRFEFIAVMVALMLLSVAVILIGVNNVRSNKDTQNKLDALASETDAIHSRIDAIEESTEKHNAENGEIINTIIQNVNDIKTNVNDEIKRLDDEIKRVEESKKKKKDELEQAQAVYTAVSTSYEGGSGYDHPFRSQGVTSDGAYKYTWYSQRALAGEGLSIPDRHVNEDGFVVDGDGNLCVALDNVPMGTEIDTPFGKAKVYDRVSPDGSSGGVIDVYTDW
jgi:uncharacterized protein YoxC